MRQRTLPSRSQPLIYPSIVIFILCDFQAGVGPKPLEPLGMGGRALPSADRMSHEQLIELARAISNSGDSVRFKEFNAVVTAEGERVVLNNGAAKALGAAMPPEKRSQLLAQ